MISIADNLDKVSKSIKKAETDSARPEGSVSLLPVSKTQSAETLTAAIELGLDCFGENYLNEALAKQNALQECLSEQAYQALVWHFIGPIQSNKTRAIAEHFDWVQSLDRIKIAKRLNEQRPTQRQPLAVCIQVNVDDEATKSGISLTELDALAEQVAELPNLQLRGLMAIPAAKASAEQQAQSFARMQQAFKQLKAQYPSVDTLSMGMSGDMALAIAHGSTMVRVGTALFGARAPKA